MKKVIIIAGPNGAGKTTFAREFLPNEAGLPVFLNADLIAAGFSPFDPEAAAIRAGRAMLEEIDRHAAEGRSFAFETTLSGHAYLRRIDAWRADGYIVKLIFLSLDSPEEAIARVATRVRQGGHSIPPEVVRRRFAAGLRNFRELYCDRVWITGSGTTTAVRSRGCCSEEASVSNEPEPKSTDPDMEGVEAALLRAAQRAREIARKTSTPLIIVRDGVLVQEWVKDTETDSSR